MNLYTGLLFLHGHVADPALAASLAALPATRAIPPASRSHSMDLFKSLMYLGGRPMHSGYNFDLEEPFEPSFGNQVAAERVFGKARPPQAPALRQTTPRPGDGFAAQGCG